MRQFIRCELCHKRLRFLGNHPSTHGFTSGQYRQKFPDAETISPETRKRRNEALNSSVRAELYHASRVGVPRDQETREKISRSLRSSDVFKAYHATRKGVPNSPEMRKKISEGLKNSVAHQARFIALTGVPRKPEVVRKISEGVRRSWIQHPEQRQKADQTMLRRASERGLRVFRYGTKGKCGYFGYRPDLGLVVRSETEATYLRYLLLQGLDFVYEPKRFPLWNKGGRVITTYCPDLYLPASDEFVEIVSPKGGSRKGWKIGLFSVCYPKLKLRVVDKVQLKHAKRILRDHTPGSRKRQDMVRTSQRCGEDGRNGRPVIGKIR